MGGVTPPLLRYRLDVRHSMFAAKAVKFLGGQKRSVKGRKYWKIDLNDTSLDRGITTYFTNEEW